ncbi:MAG: DNA primase [Verrucomicrobiales bacterium]
MARFSSATLDQVRQANDIVDIIGAVVPLKRASGNFVALCPFHKEKTPSFHVTPSKQIFHCFGCHKGGDVFSFIVDYERITFYEAVVRLAERAKIPLEIDAPGPDDQHRFAKDKLLDIHEQITQRWHAALLNEAIGEPARAYLESRQVSQEAITLFRLGFSPDSWDDTVNWAKSKKYDLDLVEQAGLISKKEDSSRYYGRFRGRLMFPICDEQGRVIGFSGRVLPGDEDDRKYVNSPETPLFTKSKVIYGLDKTKRAILEKQQAIICEGQLDLIACYMAGIQNLAAPQGTALTNEHCRILKRYAPEAVLCFDSDLAGQKAAVRSMDDLIGSGLTVRVAKIPPPDDPDSFIKTKGKEAFEELINRAEPFFDFYLNKLCADNDISQETGQRTVVREMTNALKKHGSDMLIDLYARKTAARFGVTALAATREFNRLAKSTPPPERPRDRLDDEPEEEPEFPPPNQNERWLLKWLLMDDDLVEWSRAHLDIAWLLNPLVREILEARLAPNEDGSIKQAVEVLHEIPHEQGRSLLTEIIADQRDVPDRAKGLADLVKKFRNATIDREMAAITQRAHQPGIKDEEMVHLLRSLDSLRQQKKSPLEPMFGTGMNELE